MTIAECMEIVTKVMAQNKVLCFPNRLIPKTQFYFTQVPHFANYFSGDPYVGPRDREIKEKNNRIEELEKEVKRLKAQVVALEGRYVSFIPFATP